MGSHVKCSGTKLTLEKFLINFSQDSEFLLFQYSASCENTGPLPLLSTDFKMHEKTTEMWSTC